MKSRQGPKLTNLHWLRVAIHLRGGRKALARRARIKKGRITEWLNGTRKISLIQAIKIEMATEGLVNRLDLVTNLDAEIRAYLAMEQKVLKTAKMTCGLQAQVELGLAHERVLRDVKEKKKQGITCENFHTKNSHFTKVKGRIDQIAAEHAGFGNYRTYRNAKEIVASQLTPLVEAIDRKKVSIDRGLKIVRCQPKKQAYLLGFLNNKKELIRVMESKMDEGEYSACKKITKKLPVRIADFESVT